jgi:hypothetical protein
MLAAPRCSHATTQVYAALAPLWLLGSRNEKPVSHSCMLFRIECCGLLTVRHAFANVRKHRMLKSNRHQIGGNMHSVCIVAKGPYFEIHVNPDAVRSEFGHR